MAGCSTGDGIEDRNGVGVGVCAGVGVAIGVGLGVDVGVAVGVALGVEVSVGVGVGVDVGAGDRGNGDGVGNADSVGDGEGCSTDGSSVGSVSAVLVDFSLGPGGGVRVDPGSDQSPALFPLTKVVCNLVCPCSLITGPSNFP